MPAPAFDRSYFHPVYLDLFWQFLTERMRVYWRRKAGDPPPWTNDPIIRNEFITNIYRELDPGTVYLQNRVLHDEAIEDIDKMFNVMVYRLMGSKVEFHEHLDIYLHTEFDGTSFAEQCKAVEEELRTSPFGEAYRTAAYTDMGSKEKIVNVGLLLQEIAGHMPRIYGEIQNAQTLEQVYRILESTRGFGEFLAYQIMVDFMYEAPFDPLIPFHDNEWAMAGPGARRGIWQMLTPGMKPSSMLEVLVWLRDHQHEEFERLGLDFPFLMDREDNPVHISLCNIQASLCEYFKYARIWKGETKAVRKYFYSEPQLATLNEPSVITVTKPSEPVPVGDVMVGAVGPDGLNSGEDAGLPLGAGSAPVPGELLQHGVGGDRNHQAVSSPQSPANHSQQLVGSVVSELGLGSLVVQGNGRLGSLPEAHDLRADVVEAFLHRRLGLRLDRQVIDDLITVVDHSAGAGQGQVQTQGSKAVHLHLHL